MLDLKRSHKPLILIVDDNLKNIQVLGSILAHNHYDLLIARNGIEAIEKMTKQKPDLVLLDVMMPELDGFQTCEKIRLHDYWLDIPIIFLTAKSEEDDITRGFEVGAVDYVTKPFRAAELLSRIRTHLELKQKREQIEDQSNERKQLLHILCHDLSNPLGSLLSIIELVKDQPEDLIQYVDLMEKALTNSLDIIQLIRKLRALEDGKVQLSLHPTPLHEAVKSSLRILSHIYQDKEITIHTTIPEDISVLTDEVSLISTVLNNLITNAIKFSKRGADIHIYAKANELEATLFIQDSGIGIPDKLMTTLFSLSHSTSRTGTEDETGTGFGMPLVKKFVEFYGGRLEISSKDIKQHPDDHGTLVQLILPKSN